MVGWVCARHISPYQMKFLDTVTAIINKKPHTSQSFRPVYLPRALFISSLGAVKIYPIHNYYNIFFIKNQKFFKNFQYFYLHLPKIVSKISKNEEILVISSYNLKFYA